MCLGIAVPQYAQFMMTHWGTPWLHDIGIDDKSKFVALSTAPLIPGALLSLISGVMVDRFGLKRVLMICYTITVLAIVARIWATTYEMMFICMMLMGVAATFFNSNQMKIVGRWFPEGQSVMALGLFVAFNNGSMALGTGIATLFSDYRTCFISSAVFGVIIWLAWLIFGREKPKGAVLTADDTPPILECLKVVVRSRSMWIVAICMTLFQSSALTISQFLLDAMKEQINPATLQPFDGGFAAVFPNVFTASALVGCLIAPGVIRRAKHPKVLFAAIGLFSAIGVAFAWQIPSLPLKIAALAVLGFVTLGCTPLLTGLPLTFPEIGKKYAGTAGGFMATLMLAANVIIPRYITMPLANNKYELFFMFEGGIMLIFVFLTPLLPLRAKSEK